MAEIAWTEEAQRWLEDIYTYIATNNPRAAARTVQGIYERAQDLARFPEIGYRYPASSRHVRILVHGGGHDLRKLVSRISKEYRPKELN